ncbi:MAG: transcriptional repressor LexA [Pirellulaceae bacterium]
MTNETLTERQQEVLSFVGEQIRSNHIAPTLVEICKHFGFASPNAAKNFLNVLEKKGYLKRSPNKSRSIQIVDERSSPWSISWAGDVAAGALTTAEESVEVLDLESQFGDPENFALRVKGDSMIDEQIRSGDFVIVHPQKKANPGAMVVARTDEGEATLKFYHPERNRIRLEPGNREMKAIYVKEVEIVGIVIGVVRQLKTRRN